jgi:homoserine dehydrogenase
MQSAYRPIRVALLGAGSVGAQVARLLVENREELAKRVGAELQLVGVAVRDVKAKRSADISKDLLTTDAESLLSGAEIVIELMGGIDPAYDLIKKALNSGADVITANKALIAAKGNELIDLAQQLGAQLYYEAAVGGAIPIIRPLRESLAGDKINRVMGIVNGTTNFILTQMEQGLDYADALAEAQRLGYAEADPTGDVEGHDAAGKAAILANVLMNAGLRPADVATNGITKISAADVKAAQAAGERWKLIAEVKRTDTGVTASVQPMRLPMTHPLAGVAGATNALTYTTDLLGEVTVIGAGAGGVVTGFAVVGDLLAMHRGERERANT